MRLFEVFECVCSCGTVNHIRENWTTFHCTGCNRLSVLEFPMPERERKSEQEKLLQRRFLLKPIHT